MYGVEALVCGQALCDKGIAKEALVELTKGFNSPLSEASLYGFAAGVAGVSVSGFESPCRRSSVSKYFLMPS